MTRLQAAILVTLALAIPGAAEAKVGSKAPAFRLPSVAGGPVAGQFKLADYLEKKPVVILFWGTWCAPCMEELPFYQTLMDKHAKEGLQVVSITMDDTNSVTQAGPTAKRLGVKFPVLSDLDTRVTGQLNPRRSAPYSVWIGADGRIVWEREGFALSEREVIAKAVEKFVAGQPIGDLDKLLEEAAK